VGAQVLREYIRSAGSVEAGLQRYVGSVEDPDLIYSNKVLNEYRRLQSIFRAPPPDGAGRHLIPCGAGAASHISGPRR
jgi:hypothetical protein